MKDYLNEYLVALRVERNLSSKTCEAYKRDLNDYLTFIKSKKINELFEITQISLYLSCVYIKKGKDDGWLK